MGSVGAVLGGREFWAGLPGLQLTLTSGRLVGGGSGRVFLSASRDSVVEGGVLVVV